MNDLSQRFSFVQGKGERLFAKHGNTRFEKFLGRIEMDMVGSQDEDVVNAIVLGLRNSASSKAS